MPKKLKVKDAVRVAKRAEDLFSQAIRNVTPNERQYVNEAMRRVGGAISALEVAQYESGDRKLYLVEDALSQLEKLEERIEAEFGQSDPIWVDIEPGLREAGKVADVLYEDIIPRLKNKTSSWDRTMQKSRSRKRTAKRVEEMLDNLRDHLIRKGERELGLRLQDVETFRDAALITFVVPGTSAKMELGVWDIISDDGREMDFEWTISDGGSDFADGYGTWDSGRLRARDLEDAMEDFVDLV